MKKVFIPISVVDAGAGKTDHCAGIVAYEKYGDEMTKADYIIERIKSPGLARVYFMSGEADMAYTVCSTTWGGPLGSRLNIWLKGSYYGSTPNCEI